MRGKGPLCAAKNARRGITPAHAGKSEEMEEVENAARDHPRPCGEKRAR